MAVTLQGWSSLWGGLQSELRLYLLKQQADASMSQGSFLPALLLLGNCPNQAGLLTHLQQSGSLVPKSQIVRTVQSGPDWSIRCLGQGWHLQRGRAGPRLSALTWVLWVLFLDIMLFWIEANLLRLDGSLWMSVLELKFPSLKSSLWGLQGGTAFFQSALRNAGHWLLINNLSDTSALCSDPGYLLGQRCSPWESLLLGGEGRMKEKHQLHSLHSLKA